MELLLLLKFLLRLHFCFIALDPLRCIKVLANFHLDKNLIVTATFSVVVDEFGSGMGLEKFREQNWGHLVIGSRLNRNFGFNSGILLGP